MEIVLVPYLYLLISLLWIIFYPKKINYVFGYRTKTSMKNEFNWYWANFFASRFLLAISIILCLSRTLLYFNVDINILQDNLTLFVIVDVSALFVMIFVTEFFLKHITNKNS